MFNLCNIILNRPVINGRAQQSVACHQFFPCRVLVTSDKMFIHDDAGDDDVYSSQSAQLHNPVITAIGLVNGKPLEPVIFDPLPHRIDIP